MFQISRDCPEWLFVSWGVYVSSKVCSAYFKAGPLSLMLKTFGASVWDYSFVSISLVMSVIFSVIFTMGNSPVGWDCKIQWLCSLCILQCPGYYTKISDGEASVMQGNWGMRSTSSLGYFTLQADWKVIIRLNALVEKRFQRSRYAIRETTKRNICCMKNIYYPGVFNKPFISVVRADNNEIFIL